MFSHHSKDAHMESLTALGLTYLACLAAGWICSLYTRRLGEGDSALATKMRRNRGETEAKIAYRRVFEGEADVARQREVLLKLYHDNQSAELAEERLQEFKVALRARRKHLSRLR
jgi:hypothetical protein